MNEEETFVIESASPNERYVCVFEDDGETGYVYFCPLNDALEMEGVADALWIYDQISPPIEDARPGYETEDDCTARG